MAVLPPKPSRRAWRAETSSPVSSSRFSQGPSIGLASPAAAQAITTRERAMRSSRPSAVGTIPSSADRSARPHSSVPAGGVATAASRAMITASTPRFIALSTRSGRSAGTKIGSTSDMVGGSTEALAELRHPGPAVGDLGVDDLRGGADHLREPDEEVLEVVGLDVDVARLLGGEPLDDGEIVGCVEALVDVERQVALLLPYRGGVLADALQPHGASVGTDLNLEHDENHPRPPSTRSRRRGSTRSAA